MLYSASHSLHAGIGSSPRGTDKWDGNNGWLIFKKKSKYGNMFVYISKPSTFFSILLMCIFSEWTAGVGH